MAAEVGEEVLVLLPEDTSKFMAQWHGPYIMISTVSYRIWMPCHTEYMKKWNPPKNLMTVMVAQEDLLDEEELQVCTLDATPGGEDGRPSPWGKISHRPRRKTKQS